MARAANSPEIVTAYTYHLKPPYIIDLGSETGLYFDFINYLNQKTSKFQLHLTYLPRKRLDSYLEKKMLNGIVVGVNAAWFKDRSEKKYFWSPKMFDDRDEVISNVNKPIEYDSPESLFGMNIGGVLGYYYFGIDEAVELGKINRHDLYSEKALLEMIYHERVSAGIISNSTFNYLVVKHGWQGKFHLSKKPHDLYTRHVLIPRNFEGIHTSIHSITGTMTSDPEWHKILDKYHIEY
jgi:polar amino acid transport system substrate-binding protein